MPYFFFFPLKLTAPSVQPVAEAFLYCLDFVHLSSGLKALNLYWYNQYWVAFYPLLIIYCLPLPCLFSAFCTRQFQANACSPYILCIAVLWDLSGVVVVSLITALYRHNLACRLWMYFENTHWLTLNLSFVSSLLIYPFNSKWKSLYLPFWWFFTICPHWTGRKRI